MHNLATLYLAPLLLALGVLGVLIVIAAYRIWRYRRKHHGRRRVQVWAPY
jgi:uncharacterized iron-regulated membrane protein